MCMDILLNIVVQIGISIAIFLNFVAPPVQVESPVPISGGEVKHEVIPATIEKPVETHTIQIPVQTNPEVIIVPDEQTLPIRKIDQPPAPIYNVKIEVSNPEPMANPNADLIAEKEQRLAEIVTGLKTLQQEKLDLGTGITSAQEASIKQRREAFLSEQKTLKSELKALR